MKVTNQEPQRPQALRLAAEGKLNNAFVYNFFRAGLSVCLFCFILPCPAQQFSFGEQTRTAYQLALALQTDAARQLVGHGSVGDEYVTSLTHTLELLLTEDREKFDDYEARFSKLADQRLKRSARQEYQFLLAETHLQWAFIYLKFGEEFEAAAQLRRAYTIADECYRSYPDFVPIQKTYGMLQIIVGAVPDKYKWILSLLNMEGSIEGGLRHLRTVATRGEPFALEARLLLAITHGFVLQQPDSAKSIMDELVLTHPNHRLAAYVAATIAIKNAQSELALGHLRRVTSDTAGMRVAYANYLLGEVFLHKGEYDSAVSSYRWFINHYAGQNFLKDAHFKIGLCYWLSGRENDAEMFFRQARKAGRESSEADRSAGMTLAMEGLPHPTLTRARYATDGGYYDIAEQLLGSLRDKDLPDKHDQVEYFYRKARLAHATGQLRAARIFYEQTIDLAADEPWYFAPNSCLQMGYLLREENPGEARRYFQRALAYRRHEYKNSIDSKARSALNRLK